MSAHRLAVALLAAGCSFDPAPGPPAHIEAGRSDTVVVHARRPVRIPVRVLDAAGRALPDTLVRFARTAGDPIPLSERGAVHCTRAGDATVRLTLGDLTSDVALRCRPVAALRFAGPVQLVVGDPARPIEVVAYGPDNRIVELHDGRVETNDTTLAAVDGLHLRPLRQGASVVTVTVGDVRATTGLHVYAPDTTLAGLARERRLVAVPLRLAPGEVRRWTLPWGGWMISMWPAADSVRGLRLRVEGAGCTPVDGIGPRRLMCNVMDSARVIVYAPWRADTTAIAGTIAVKPNGETRVATRPPPVASRPAPALHSRP